MRERWRTVYAENFIGKYVSRERFIPTQPNGWGLWVEESRTYEHDTLLPVHGTPLEV